MKIPGIFILLFAALNFTAVFAADTATRGAPSVEENGLLRNCNLEARNALVNGDLAMMENVCTKAVEAIEKSGSGKEYLIDPIMNIAFSYTLAGQFDKAEPYYDRAKRIGEELYKPGSKEMHAIDMAIENHEKLKLKQGNRVSK